MQDIWELFMFEKDLVQVSETYFKHQFTCELKEMKIKCSYCKARNKRDLFITIINKNDLVKERL